LVSLVDPSQTWRQVPEFEVKLVGRVLELLESERQKHAKPNIMTPQPCHQIYEVEDNEEEDATPEKMESEARRAGNLADV
jgi:hypothetical protein